MLIKGQSYDWWLCGGEKRLAMDTVDSPLLRRS